MTLSSSGRTLGSLPGSESSILSRVAKTDEEKIEEVVKRLDKEEEKFRVERDYYEIDWPIEWEEKNKK